MAVLRPTCSLLSTLLLSTGALFFLSHCSSTPKDASEASGQNVAATTSSLDLDVAEASKKAGKTTNIDAAPALKSQRLVPMAFGAEGFPRVRKYYKEINGVRILERSQIDFNGDGRVDVIQYFDPTGQYVEREAVDLGGTGHMTTLSYYKKVVGQSQPELVMQEFDARFTGKPSVWKYYKGGQLVRREIDRRGLGRPDFWEYFENGKLSRIEKDENADGIPDSQPSFKQIVKPQGPEPGKTPPINAR